MKRNIYLAVIWCITAVCILVGIVIHAGGGFFALRDKLFSLSGIAGAVSGTGSGNSDTADVELSGAFHRIDIDAGVAEIEIRHGSDFGVSLRKDGIQSTCRIVDDTLKVSQEENVMSLTGENERKLTLLITTPDDIDSMETDLGVGSIRLDGVRFGNVDMDLGVGNIDSCDCDYNLLDIDCGTGDINISGLTNPETAYSFDIDSFAAITVLGSLYSTECERGSGANIIQIDCGVGNVVINE